MNEMNDEIVWELKVIRETRRKKIGELTPEQITWQPGAEGWSVGQCFEPLIKSNELFYDRLGEIAGGKHQPSFLEKFSPLSGFFRNLLINSLKKDERD